MITFEPVFRATKLDATGDVDLAAGMSVIGYVAASVDYQSIFDCVAHFGEAFGALPALSLIHQDIITWSADRDRPLCEVAQRVLRGDIRRRQGIMTREEADALAFTLQLWTQYRCDTFLSEQVAGLQGLEVEAAPC